MGVKSTGGEIVQVQGGHIIRATGRKDRHSKVFTAKGPRDRRVRLSAHTAIQFYDVQDRLGYDRPSKAVDWLITKAKASIDKLAQLPPFDPSSSANNTADVGPTSEIHGYTPQTFLSTPSQDDVSFHNYPQSQQTQDLCLSLHTSLQDPGGGGSGSSLGFDGGQAGWAEPDRNSDMGRFTRLMGWAGGGFNTTPYNAQALLLAPQGGAGAATTAYSQRGTLQSSFSPLVRGLENHQHEHEHERQHEYQHQHQQQHHQHSSFLGFGSGSDQGFMGFCIPSQIHGHELHDGTSMSNRASSSSLSPDSSQH